MSPSLSEELAEKRGGMESPSLIKDLPQDYLRTRSHCFFFKKVILGTYC